mgnify:CR=1 FL=1
MTETKIHEIVCKYKEKILGECMLKVDSIHPETISSDHDARNYLAGYISDVLEEVIALVTDK